MVNSKSDKVQYQIQNKKIFDWMKNEKQNYLKTLIKGEYEGHCRGISKRLDQTNNIRMRQEIEKRKAAEELKRELVKEMKAQRDSQRQEA